MKFAKRWSLLSERQLNVGYVLQMQEFAAPNQGSKRLQELCTKVDKLTDRLIMNIL
jgi:hypothetical protein